MSDDVGFALSLTLVVALLALRARAAIRSWRARRRLARARAGEVSARYLLVDRGFEIVAEQAPGVLVLSVDGRRSVHALRADYLVTRRGKRYVAEVKTGAHAPSLDHAPTRRQIVEYCTAFDVDGALLVDPEASRVHEIAMPARRAHRFLLGIVLGAALGITIASILLR